MKALILAGLALAGCAQPQPYRPPYVAEVAPTCVIGTPSYRSCIKAERAAIIRETAAAMAAATRNADQADRDQKARDHCAYVGTMTEINSSRGGILGNVFAGIEAQGACWNFYRQTGRLPNAG